MVKRNAEGPAKYSAGLNGVFNRTIHHLRVCLKQAERRPFDLGYEALRGAAYRAGGGLVSLAILWVSTYR
ncbi:hypothetical protein [Streptomyces sp. NPDC050392]|uniref:hypothetical protein n=1 Tax=Streptomyces sp. NPDC050392 TaxID=3155782 RepID=UPI003415071C